jgi:hypothetical protein
VRALIQPRMQFAMCSVLLHGTAVQESVHIRAATPTTERERVEPWTRCRPCTRAVALTSSTTTGGPVCDASPCGVQQLAPSQPLDAGLSPDVTHRTQAASLRPSRRRRSRHTGISNGRR